MHHLKQEGMMAEKATNRSPSKSVSWGKLYLQPSSCVLLTIYEDPLLLLPPPPPPRTHTHTARNSLQVFSELLSCLSDVTAYSTLTCSAGPVWRLLCLNICQLLNDQRSSWHQLQTYTAQWRFRSVVTAWTRHSIIMFNKNLFWWPVLGWWLLSIFLDFSHFSFLPILLVHYFNRFSIYEAAVLSMFDY